jgi:hypothetical protein
MRTLYAAVTCLFATTALAGQIAIVSPRSGDAVGDAEGRVPVTLNASLANGERVRLLLNGIVVPAAGQGDRVVLMNVERGEHRLEAEVVDDNGAVVATSVPVTFVVNRMAVGGPGRGAPPVTAPVTGATGGLPTPGPVGAPSATNPPGAVGSGNPGATAGAGNPGATAGTGNPGATVGTGNPGAAVGAGTSSGAVSAGNAGAAFGRSGR